VVLDTDHLDDRALCPVKKQVTSATTVPRNVKSTETRHDLVSRLRTSNVRAVGEFADHLNKRITIQSGLMRAEILGGPFENVCEIELRR
jgi:hypothetical protein